MTMGVRLECLAKKHTQRFKPRKWVTFKHLTPTWGLVAVDDRDEVVAMGGFLDGFPWGREVWIATSDEAGKYAVALYKTFRGVLGIWSKMLEGPLFTTTNHEMSHRLVRRMGFRIEEETPDGAVRWKYGR